MIGIIITFEIVFLIGIFIMCGFVIVGLWENGCWIFDDNWWINKRELSKLEERIVKLEEEYEKRKKIESCGEYEKKSG